MLRDDLDEELEAEAPRKDVELTLGPAVLFAVACGLILLCGLCFGVGYTSGRRSGARAASAKEAASGQTLAAQAAVAAGRKPAAKGTPPTAQAASAPAQASSGPETSAQATTPSPGVPVRQAITSQTGQPQSPLTQNPTPRVQPALPPGSGVMVQIAAVSHVEDANVLMGALRRRGYEVAARREFDDNLIHVQIGPFATRAEASAMSQRLLGDGYNAVVLP
jgi:cell division septation protein DedD